MTKRKLRILCLYQAIEDLYRDYNKYPELQKDFCSVIKIYKAVLNRELISQNYENRKSYQKN